MMENSRAIHHADRYRAISAAIRIIGSIRLDDREAIHTSANAVHYLYEQGHEHWIALLSLPVEQFALAFDASREKGKAI